MLAIAVRHYRSAAYLMWHLLLTRELIESLLTRIKNKKKIKNGIGKKNKKKEVNKKQKQVKFRLWFTFIYLCSYFLLFLSCHSDTTPLSCIFVAYVTLSERYTWYVLKYFGSFLHCHVLHSERHSFKVSLSLRMHPSLCRLVTLCPARRERDPCNSEIEITNNINFTCFVLVSSILIFLFKKKIANMCFIQKNNVLVAWLVNWITEWMIDTQTDTSAHLFSTFFKIF